MAGEERSDKNGDELAEDRTKLADERTEFAEDRTLMANERTFAGWMRTGLAGVGIGLGFNALFGSLQPWWLPRAIATAFILIGIFIMFAAQRKAAHVYDRLTCHKAEPIGGVNMRITAGVMIAASAALVAGMWMMEAGPTR